MKKKRITKKKTRTIKKTKQTRRFKQRSIEITSTGDAYKFESGNALVVLVVKTEKWSGGKYHWYPDNNNLVSDLRVSGLYAQSDIEKPRETQGVARALLCHGLQYLINEAKIGPETIIALEAAQSPNDDLVNKVYIPMGFELISRGHDGDGPETTGGLMSAKVSTITDWCSRIDHISKK